MKYFYLVMSYAFVFLIGVYSASQFRFDYPIEIYRWIIVIVFTIFFITVSSKREK